MRQCRLLYSYLKDGTLNAITVFLQFDRWCTLAWTDIRLRYRRTKLGRFWMTLNTAFFVLSVGLVWGFVFQMPMRDYLPYFALGIVVWTFISSTITEGCRVFLDAHHVIKSLPNPISLYVWRLLARQLICLAHNLLFLAILWLVIQRPLPSGALAAVPGLILLIMALVGAIFALGTLCARFRDIPQLVTSVLQVLFLVTPIIWHPARLATSPWSEALFYANPIYDLIVVIRSPILGEETTALHWLGASFAAVSMLLVGLTLFGRFSKRIAYWL